MQRHSPTEIHIKQDGESITIEMDLPPAVILEHLEQLGDCRRTRSSYRTLAAYYSAYSRKTIPAEDIIYLQADHAYCTFHLSDGSHLIKSKPMSYFLERYYAGSLVRIHKTYSVNRNFFRQITSAYIVLRDDTRLPVGRRCKTTVYLSG